MYDWLITPHFLCRIKKLGIPVLLEDGKLEIKENKIVVKTGKKRFMYRFDEYRPIDFIYTDIYEEPDTDDLDPIPADELETAVFSNDLSLQVRAWNTMYANPKGLANMINHILENIAINDESEMTLSVFISHFHKKGILTKENEYKFRDFLE